MRIVVSDGFHQSVWNMKLSAGLITRLESNSFAFLGTKEYEYLIVYSINSNHWESKIKEIKTR